MTQGLKAVVYTVKDLAAAKKLFGAAIGVQPNVDQPYYVNYSLGGIDVGLVPGSQPDGASGPVAYWHTDDIANGVQQLVAAGGRVMQPAKDVGGGKQVATVQVADGNVIGLMQPAPSHG